MSQIRTPKSFWQHLTYDCQKFVTHVSCGANLLKPCPVIVGLTFLQFRRKYHVILLFTSWNSRLQLRLVNFTRNYYP